MNAPDYFIPDRDLRQFYPLRDFLRAPPISVVEKYIDALTAPGDLVIDPFGTTPNVARAALALGRRAIIVEANPLWAWLSRAMASLPSESEINAALVRLGDTIKDDVSLRAHINQLYTTTCAACGKSTPADYFVRVRDGGTLQRHYTCAHCGETRDDSATEDDLKRAAAFDAHGLHYHMAFERVVPADNFFSQRIEKMLDVYTPRNLYALVTLTQKIDSLFRVERERNILLVLLLHLLDRGTSFYSAPDATAQLTTHKQFIEFNLWHEIESAAHALGQAARQSFALTKSVNEVIESNEPRAFIGHGRAKTLASKIPHNSAALVITAPPTRRVAVWALSYFWGAWILGRTAVEPLVPFLDSKKDAPWEWRWYTDTLNDSMNAIANLLRVDAHAAFIFNESWQLVIENLLLAASGAHLGLESFLFQPRVGDSSRREFDDLRGDYRITFTPAPTPWLWQTAPQSPPPSRTGEGAIEQAIRASALAAGSAILAHRGEALAYSWVHHAAWTRIAREGLIDQVVALQAKTPPGRFIHNAVVAGLSEGYAHDFDHYETPTQFLWFRRSKELSLPLIDRVEEAVRELLARPDRFPKPVRSDELEDTIYRQFPGDLTPEAGLVELCAQACANAGQMDDEKARAMELLSRVGEKLGHTVAYGESRIADSQSQIADDENGSTISHTPSAIRLFDLVWQSDGELAHGFVWRERAEFADLLRIHLAPARGYIVVPESIVALMQEKLRRLPHIAETFYEVGWNFVRVPFVEKLLEHETIEKHDLIYMMGLVPPSMEQKAQLELFDNT